MLLSRDSSPVGQLQEGLDTVKGFMRPRSILNGKTTQAVDPKASILEILGWERKADASRARMKKPSSVRATLHRRTQSAATGAPPLRGAALKNRTLTTMTIKASAANSKPL
ncbi:hypothetical protein PCAU_5378 [Pseudomonas chlororaphis subsp. aurantiaca]|nr:hypothetical protein PCAU_5378 [Pseudomonas chlororaphis subsp. aurantiaca]